MQIRCIVNIGKTYAVSSHRVKGHSHIPLKSGFFISLCINSPGDKPSRPSQSGSHPASGAVRSGEAAVAGFSTVDESLVLALWLEIGAKAAAVVERDREMATVTIFMVGDGCYACGQRRKEVEKRMDLEGGIIRMYKFQVSSR